MKNILYHIAFFTIVFGGQECYGQKPCNYIFEVAIEDSGIFDKESILMDSLKKDIQIIFEQKLNDTIYVFTDNKLIENKKVTTHKFLGASMDAIFIDYSKSKKVPKISIIISGKDCIAFYPQIGKRIAYINFIKGAWSVELSNVVREYR